MSQDQGASARADRATRASPEPASGLGQKASVPCAFTPGPWAVHDHRDLNGNWWIGPGQFDTIAEARMGHDDIPGDVLANANLIATAPELYDALASLLTAVEFVNVMPGPKGIDLRGKAHQALAKARGEQVLA